MKIVFLAVVVFLGVFRVEAQKVFASLENKGDGASVSERREDAAVSYRWEFWSSPLQGAVVNRSHEEAFGNEVACLLGAVEGAFLKREQVVAGDPQVQATIRKPGIYNAVRNIEKYYRRKSKQGDYTERDAALFAHVMRVALACVDSEDSDGFEAALQQSRKEVAGQLACFRQVKLNDLYE